MHVDELRKLVHRQPFRPVDLRLADGTLLTVLHPESVAVARDTVFVVQPDGDWEMVDPAQIISVLRSKRNGVKSRR